MLQRNCRNSWIGPVLLGSLSHVTAEPHVWETFKEVWEKCHPEQPLPVYTQVVHSTSAVSSVCVTPDGQHVVSGSGDKTIRITCVDDGKLVREIKGHSDKVRTVCVTPDGKHIVSGSWDKTVRITRVDNGKLVREIKGHSDRVTSVCVTPDGQHIVSGSRDKTIRITRVDGGELDDGKLVREIK